MVNNNEEKLNKGEGQVDDKDNTLSNEELKEAEIYLAEEEVAEAKEFIRDEEIKNDGKLLHYTKVILSGIVDQIFAMLMAMLIFGVFGLVVRLFGYKIAMREEVFLITYIISNSVYYPVIQEFLHGKTLGKKFIFR